MKRQRGSDDANSVEHDSVAQEFRIALGDETAVLQYRRDARGLNIFHTEVPIAHRRQGIAHRLAHAALEFAKENDLRVTPTCPFVADYIRSQ